MYHHVCDNINQYIIFCFYLTTPPGPKDHSKVQWTLRPLGERGDVLFSFAMPLHHVYHHVLAHLRCTFHVFLPFSLFHLPPTEALTKHHEQNHTHPSDNHQHNADLEAAVTAALSTPLLSILTHVSSFRVSVRRTGRHTFSAQDFEQSLGGILNLRGHKVDLTQPEC